MLLPVAAFLAFFTYAVCVSHTPSINANCGENLWVFMCVRLALCFGGVFVLIVPFALLGFVFQHFVAAGVIIGLIFEITMVSIGAPLAANALANSTSVAAMSAACFTNSPLLAIFGVICTTLDCFFLLLIVVGGCIALFRD